MSEYVWTLLCNERQHFLLISLANLIKKDSLPPQHHCQVFLARSILSLAAVYPTPSKENLNPKHGLLAHAESLMWKAHYKQVLPFIIPSQNMRGAPSKPHLRTMGPPSLAGVFISHFISWKKSIILPKDTGSSKNSIIITMTFCTCYTSWKQTKIFFLETSRN